MTLGRYVLTATVVIPAGVPSYSAAGPVTTTPGTATGATPAGLTVIATQTLATGTFLLSWTATLQTAAAAGDANNFGLYGGAGGTTLLATSVNAGTVGRSEEHTSELRPYTTLFRSGPPLSRPPQRQATRTTSACTAAQAARRCWPRR